MFLDLFQLTFSELTLHTSQVRTGAAPADRTCFSPTSEPLPLPPALPSPLSEPESLDPAKASFFAILVPGSDVCEIRKFDGGDSVQTKYKNKRRNLSPPCWPPSRGRPPGAHGCGGPNRCPRNQRMSDKNEFGDACRPKEQIRNR